MSFICLGIFKEEVSIKKEELVGVTHPTGESTAGSATHHLALKRAGGAIALGGHGQVAKQQALPHSFPLGNGSLPGKMAAPTRHYWAIALFGFLSRFRSDGPGSGFRQVSNASYASFLTWTSS